MLETRESKDRIRVLEIRPSSYRIMGSPLSSRIGAGILGARPVV
jgi:hypothetical protein